MMKYALLYKPPCGTWYVHSHKLYDNAIAARDAAMKFLPPRTPISIIPITDAMVQFHSLDT